MKLRLARSITCKGFRDEVSPNLGNVNNCLVMALKLASAEENELWQRVGESDGKCIVIIDGLTILISRGLRGVQ